MSRFLIVCLTSKQDNLNQLANPKFSTDPGLHLAKTEGMAFGVYSSIASQKPLRNYFSNKHKNPQKGIRHKK